MLYYKMCSIQDVMSSEIVEVVEQTERESVPASVGSLPEVSSGEQSVSAILPEIEGEIDEFTNRRNGWIDIIGRAQLRKRLLHDIVPADSEDHAIKLFEKLQRRIQENQRGSGVIVAAGHLDGLHSHVHVVHDCNWNSTTCKDIFIQGIPIKKRQSKYNRWSEQLLREFWENLLHYLFGRGRR